MFKCRFEWSLLFCGCERYIYILSKILTNASYAFILEKKKQAEMERKDFLCSNAAFVCMMHTKECRVKGNDSVYLHTYIWLFSLTVASTQLSVWIIFALSMYGIQKASRNKGSFDMFAMDIAFFLIFPLG